MRNPEELAVFRQAELLAHAVYEWTASFRYQRRFAEGRGYGDAVTGRELARGIEQLTKALIAFGKTLRAQTPNPKP